jgi:hypothetical protein
MTKWSRAEHHDEPDYLAGHAWLDLESGEIIFAAPGQSPDDVDASTRLLAKKTKKTERQVGTIPALRTVRRRPRYKRRPLGERKLNNNPQQLGIKPTTLNEPPMLARISRTSPRDTAEIITQHVLNRLNTHKRIPPRIIPRGEKFRECFANACFVKLRLDFARSRL